MDSNQIIDGLKYHTNTELKYSQEDILKFLGYLKEPNTIPLDKLLFHTSITEDSLLQRIHDEILPN